jgi:hypothetical protein
METASASHDTADAKLKDRRHLTTATGNQQEQTYQVEISTAAEQALSKMSLSPTVLSLSQ